MIQSELSKNLILYSNPASLPTKRKRFTILRGPHKDKDSRIQLKVERHKKVNIYIILKIDF